MTQNTGKSGLDIIVPFGTWNNWVIECISACTRCDGADKTWTMWLVADEEPAPGWRERLDAIRMPFPYHILPTGPANPSRKRNSALKESRATVVALIDSDAWPHPKWIANALPLLDENYGIVTGPNLTPDQDPIPSRVCGRVMESPLGFGKGYIRHILVPRHEVDEMPTCNMIFRRHENIWFRDDLDTAEDMAFCADMRAAGVRILYTPDVIVYHHRRTLWSPFIRQFYWYGFHKGRLCRDRSLLSGWWHAVPALLLAYSAFYALFALWVPLGMGLLFAAPILLYMGLVVLESARRVTSFQELIWCIPAFPVAHAAYGAGYWAGLLNP